jgi:hypothetical protein
MITGRIEPCSSIQEAGSAQPERAPTWVGGFGAQENEAPEMTTNQGKSWTPSESTVNGPERRTDWNATDWKRAHRNVRRLRQRLFRATQVGDFKKVRSLQKQGTEQPEA